jgi:hypothetical protein
VRYSPNALLQFAIQLIDFQKVCREKSDWKQTLSTNLQSKLDYVKKMYQMDLDFAPKCVLEQSEVMKKNFEKHLLETKITERQYCSCKKLTEHKITTTVSPVAGKKSFTSTTTPFGSYSSTLTKKCAQVCSGEVVLEYEEE